jgi:hypothetical protein
LNLSFRFFVEASLCPINTHNLKWYQLINDCTRLFQGFTKSGCFPFSVIDPTPVTPEGGIF